MPDSFCKSCYKCEEIFTIMRRRHHCRICGQVFCSSCSNYTLDGALFNTQGVIRSCQSCYIMINEQNNNIASYKKKDKSNNSGSPEDDNFTSLSSESNSPEDICFSMKCMSNSQDLTINILKNNPLFLANRNISPEYSKYSENIQQR